ncbi:PREDICTED: putative disease resistance RPP13-like protein 1 [Nicotiana attenuata]|uniref:putative disease resistance RPP13-like protein 1 n=1 Tax=Nicotiana attenuata TaxID=49451 RepID=UPI000905A092|nr:PREDICTED: putative disease resistance RPP13-like protein 1 [Nicotiana attenuata]
MGFKEEVRAGFIAGAALILLEGIAKFAVSEISKFWNVDAELRRLERCVSKVMAMIEWVEDGHCNCFSSERSKKAWELWLEDVKTVARVVEDEISLELDHHNRVKDAANASSSQEEHPLRKKILTSGKLNVPHEISKLREKLEDLAGEMDKLLSFESLKSEKTTQVVTSSSSTSFVELKKCFAYCALFPASYKFEEDNLVLMWLAEGLIQPMGEITLECIGKQYFKDLAGRSFFYLEKKKIYNMHDFFREMAQFISTDVCLQMEDEKPTCYPSLGNIRHLSLCCNNLVSDEYMEEFPKCERLRTFLLTCRNVDAGVGDATTYLLQNFSLLRVLDLSHGHIVELPDTIGNLMYLRYLNLSGNLLRYIPESIGKLFYLQTLQLNSCEELSYLPASLRNLGNLRHLQFDNCWQIDNMPL